MKNKESQAKESCFLRTNRTRLVAETNRTRFPNIYGTSSMHQAQPYATYLHELIQQGALEVGVTPLSISRGRNRGRERLGKLSKVVELGFEPGYTGSGSQAVSHCTVLQEEKYKGQDCSSERVP